MIIEFTCPKCGTCCRALDQYAGRKAQCRGCQAIVLVPGLPPIQAAPEVDTGVLEPLEPETDSALSRRRYARLETESRSDEASTAADNSYGLASLYLATLSFLLFFTPALLAGMTGAIGASIAFFAGIFVSSGCFTFCWHGYRLAKEAEGLSMGKGYAEAGKIVNKFFLTFYVVSIAFFLVGGIITLVYAKQYTNQVQDQLKGLDQLKDIGKLLGQ